MSTKAMIEWDLRNNPLGFAKGDPLLGAQKAPAARVFLRNHSAKTTRKYVKQAVSFRRGAAEALAADGEMRKVYNIATLESAIERGIDKNVYGTTTARVMFAPLFNNVRYPIPPAKGDEDPPLVQVPEGLWDLLMGNYERMHDPDPRVRSDEMSKFANSQAARRSPILYVTVDGKQETRSNPFGFIEIIRMTEKLEPVAPDTEFLTALELVES